MVVVSRSPSPSPLPWRRPGTTRPLSTRPPTRRGRGEKGELREVERARARRAFILFRKKKHRFFFAHAPQLSSFARPWHSPFWQGCHRRVSRTWRTPIDSPLSPPHKENTPHTRTRTHKRPSLLIPNFSLSFRSPGLQPGRPRPPTALSHARTPTGGDEKAHAFAQRVLSMRRDSSYRKAAPPPRRALLLVLATRTRARPAHSARSTHTHSTCRCT